MQGPTKRARIEELNKQADHLLGLPELAVDKILFKLRIQDVISMCQINRSFNEYCKRRKIITLIGQKRLREAPKWNVILSEMLFYNPPPSTMLFVRNEDVPPIGETLESLPEVYIRINPYNIWDDKHGAIKIRTRIETREINNPIFDMLRKFGWIVLREVGKSNSPTVRRHRGKWSIHYDKDITVHDKVTMHDIYKVTLQLFKLEWRLIDTYTNSLIGECVQCGAMPANMMCGHCEQVTYCSKICGNADWEKHFLECGK